MANPDITLPEVAAIILGASPVQVAGLTREEVASVVWERVGQNFDTGIGDLALATDTTPERLIELLTIEGLREAQQGERGARAYWLEALLVLGLLLGAALAARSWTGDEASDLAGVQGIVSRGFAGPSLLVFSILEFDADGHAEEGMHTLARRLRDDPALPGDLDLSGLTAIAAPAGSDDVLAYAGAIPIGGVAAPVAFRFERDGRQVSIMQSVGLAGGSRDEVFTIMERLVDTGSFPRLLPSAATPAGGKYHTGGLWEELPTPGELPPGYTVVKETTGLDPMLFGVEPVTASTPSS